MAPSSRDRISVDLRGLKAALFERAQGLGISPSGLVRKTLAEVLGQSDPIHIDRSMAPSSPSNGDRVRLSLRMSREQAIGTLNGARRAGLHPGDYVGDLVAGVPVLLGAGNRGDHLAALIASSAEVSTLSRNIHHLIDLLNRGQMRAALEYRDMLNTLEGAIRAHLKLASSTLADLRPRGGGAGAGADRRRPH